MFNPPGQRPEQRIITARSGDSTIDSTTNQLCDLGQITSLPWASPQNKENKNKNVQGMGGFSSSF